MLASLLSMVALLTASGGVTFTPKVPNGKSVVLIAGDDEYFSEESMPRLASILAERHGFSCTVLFPIHPKFGVIDQTIQDNIPGLEALKTADLMVIFTRFRCLPDFQMKHIVDFVDRGKPVIGLRTATHAFKYPADSQSPYKSWSWDANGGFGRKILGETWIAHHGGHGSQSTRGIIATKHPILNGIEDGSIWGVTDVYAITKLPADATVLLRGAVLTGMKPTDRAVEGPQNSPMQPIAWTRTIGKQRVFTTTMGGAMAGGADFDSEPFRRLMINAVYWCVGMEAKIPAKADAKDTLNPNPYKRGVRID